jgi:hypothetical protein
VLQSTKNSKNPLRVEGDLFIRRLKKFSFLFSSDIGRLSFQGAGCFQKGLDAVRFSKASGQVFSVTECLVYQDDWIDGAKVKAAEKNNGRFR